MISSFITIRKHGLVRHSDDDILKTVNSHRLGLKYADEDKSAIDLHETEKTKPISKTIRPQLSTYSDYGKNRDGFWNYNHMAVVSSRREILCFKDNAASIL